MICGNVSKAWHPTHLGSCVGGKTKIKDGRLSRVWGFVPTLLLCGDRCLHYCLLSQEMRRGGGYRNLIITTYGIKEKWPLTTIFVCVCLLCLHVPKTPCPLNTPFLGRDTSLTDPSINPSTTYQGSLPSPAAHPWVPQASGTLSKGFQTSPGQCIHLTLAPQWSPIVDLH